MTPEQLLIPRYEVIADYPDSPFEFGQIIELPNKDGKGVFWTDKIYVRYIEMAFNTTFFSDYHHIFRLMNWSEGRELSELPEYVRMTFYMTPHFIKGEVAKTIDVLEVSGSIDGLGDECTPATEAEYLAQNQK